MIEPSDKDLRIAREMRAGARSGWYTGTKRTLVQYGVRRVLRAATEPELMISMTLSRDKMHHSVGWWRNAEYEYCWHLSLAAKEFEPCVDADTQAEWEAIPFEQVPREEAGYWSRCIFLENHTLLWFEPGGTDPRLTREEARAHATMWHMRMFMEPTSINEKLLPWTGVPFIPAGEVYTLTRWIPGLTPEKVDR